MGVAKWRHGLTERTVIPAAWGRRPRPETGDAMRRRMRVQDVVVGDRKRTLDQTKVAELAESLSRLGLLNPITVSDSGQLLAGLHRLEAARSLGWKWIDVTVTSLDELASELVEIDENLVRAELSVLERAEHLQRRRRIYEDIHPETVRPKGGPGVLVSRRRGHQGGHDRPVRATGPADRGGHL